MGSIALSPGSGPGPAPAGDYDAIVGAIYECVIEPAGWPSALDRIRSFVGGKAAWIAVHYPGQLRSVYEIETGTDPEQQRRLRAQFVAASPFIGAVHYVSRADVISVADVVDYEEFLSGRFYREWAGPQGWPDFIMGVLAREADRFTWLGICMGEKARPEHKERVAGFLPHVERAVRISDLLEQRTAQAADLAAMAESLATGMILVDAGCGVRGVNIAARHLMGDAPGFAIVEGWLRTPVNAPGAAIRAAISACADARLESAGATVLLGDGADALALLVHVIPLPRALTDRAESAVAALFLTRPAAPAPASIDAFIARFGLTPSETRVLLALLDGKNPRAIAAQQGVAMPTVRTHLRRLYEKTRTAGQADLVRLVASLRPAI